jgi:single-strand DNA-binding protein
LLRRAANAMERLVIFEAAMKGVYEERDRLKKERDEIIDATIKPTTERKCAIANLNKVLVIGRLTRDVEVRMFPNGGKVAKFGFACNNRKKNPQSGQYEDDPVFLDMEAFNRGESSKTADLVEQYLRKGSQAFIEGHLQLDQWTTQSGEKRSKLKIVVDNVQFLDPKPDGQGGGDGQRSQGQQRGGYQRPANQDADDYSPPPPTGDTGIEVPF